MGKHSTEIGSVYDRSTQITGNFDIWKDGYANTNYSQIVKPLTGKSRDWATQAKLDWTIEEAQAGYIDEDGKFHKFDRRKMLVRSDNGKPLAMVGHNYNAVQPTDILSFFAKIAKTYGFKLQLAGEALNGRRIFALAECPQITDLGGGDRIANYLMLVTHNDGTGATRCFFTSIRFWCMNQLPMMLNDRSARDSEGSVSRQTHSRLFDPADMDVNLRRINRNWNQFADTLAKMREVKVTPTQARIYLGTVFGRLDDDGNLTREAANEDRKMVRILDSYKTGQGQEGIKGTVFGLLNGVTRFLDHDTNYRTQDAAVASTWLGRGRQVKELAYNEALKLVA